MSNERYIPDKNPLVTQETPPAGVSSESAIPLKVQELIDGIPYLAPTPERLLYCLAINFQMPVAPASNHILRRKGVDNILRRKTRKERLNLWADNLKGLVCVVRKVLPAPLALYNVFAHYQYLLDWQHPVGTWILTKDRLGIINAMPPEIQPLMTFCHQVQVKDLTQLVGRLNPTELSLMNRLGRAYPEPVRYDDLAYQVWPYLAEEKNDLSGALKTHAICLRRKIHQFDGGAFDLTCDRGVGYRLVQLQPTVK